MVSRALAAAAVAGAFACALLAPAASAVHRPPVTVVRGDGSYTKAGRGRQAITTIVIHATDGGSLLGNVWWLSGGHSHASAHYVVSRDGEIVQLVHLSDIAWHAGNWRVNCNSIGIEHVGDTYDPTGFTTAEYKASARLVGWLVRRYDIPVDREHIIGHYQVPDPNHPGEYGGSAHHTDPGPYWRWPYYMNLVRHYAFPERYAVHVDTTTIEQGSRLTGIVPWKVRTKRARRVDFLVDGRLVWSDSRRPFAFAGGRGWNTTEVANGTHVLTVRATGRNGKASQRLRVRVLNRDFALTTSALHPWQKVKGLLRVRANVRGAHTTGIGLYVDGRIVSRDRRSPYAMRWDSRRVHDGRHWVTLGAVATDGRVAKRRLPVVVANHPPLKKPAPRPQSAPEVTAENLVDGATLTGVVDWRAHTIGPVARVEFVVDGAVIATSRREPWATSWDTSTVTTGPHTLDVRAYTVDGRSAVRSIGVVTSSG